MKTETKKCAIKCEFDGPYKIKASSMTVEMKCIKCGEVSSWTFDEFDEIENKNK